jgi:lipoate-protein ligase A
MHPGPTERPAATWRLLVEPDADGAENMAVDETLLDAYLTPEGRDAGPTLRLYGWDPATLSLGKAQPAIASHDPRYLADQGLGLVRRPTGGQAVLHEGERTYSVAGRLDRPPFDGGVLATYAAISEALRTGLALLGLRTAPAVGRPGERGRGPVCFNTASTHELQHRGRKLVGSAQMRRRKAFLQHGSIPFNADAKRLGAAIGTPADGGRFTALSELLGRTPEKRELDRALIAGFETRFGVEILPGRRSRWERQRIEALRCWKYLSASWTFRGKIGEVERARAPRGLFLPPAG